MGTFNIRRLDIRRPSITTIYIAIYYYYHGTLCRHKAISIIDDSTRTAVYLCRLVLCYNCVVFVRVVFKMENTFNNRLNNILDLKKPNSTYLSKLKYDELIVHLKELKLKKTKIPNDYKLIKKYDTMRVCNVEKLVVPINEGNQIKYYVHNEELFNILHETHLSIGHGGRSRMEHELNIKYKNITREAIMLYLNLCESCQKKGSTIKKGLVVKPIISKEMNSRCQIDLIDMQAQPDGNYKFILVYQDHLTKFVNLRPLSNKRAEEVAYVLLDIFTTFGAPAILQSDNGREFSNKIVEELCSMWKDLKIVHGKPRHSQSQGSVERANQDIENMLGTWLEDNKTKKWSEGIKFVQFMKNRSFHHGIKSSPYEAMFGSRAKIGLNNCVLPMHVVEKLKTEEDLEKALNTIEEKESKEKNKEGNEVIVEENEENYNSEDALSSRKLSIQIKRNESVQNLEKQANKMKSLSERRFCEGNIGDSVKIKIPDVDRARSDLRSILAVIISSIINNNILIIICCLICLFIITIFFL